MNYFLQDYFRIDPSPGSLVKKAVLPLLILFFVVTDTFSQELAKANTHDRSAVKVSQKQQDRQALKLVLSRLEAEYNIHFYFDPGIVNDKFVENDALENGNLEQILTAVLKPLQLRHKKIEDNYYVIQTQKEDKEIEKIERKPVKKSGSPDASNDSFDSFRHESLKSRKLHNYLMVLQEKIVTGQIIAADNDEPLPGVNILIKGTTTGTVTDVNGNYRITVPDEGAVLVFSSIGYVSEEIAVGDQTVINLSMAPDIQALQEIVVVGYGNQERRDVTGAIATINVEAVKDFPLTTLDQKLSGQVAGVQVTPAGGTPGGGVVVRVRGSGSIGAGDDPLYVVDGFPITNEFGKAQNPLSTINPDDIESISVLKDAASTAIYGSRGSNGVILITTKKAKAGQTNVSFSAYGGFQQVPERNKPDMMTAEEFARWRVEHREDLAAFRGEVFDPSTVPAEFQNPSALGAGTNWFEELTRVAPMQNYNVTISGGSEKFRTLISGSYFNQQGVIINTNFERYALRANLEADVHDRVTVGMNLAPAFVNKNYAETEGHFNSGLITQGTLSSPLAPVYQSDGSFNPCIGCDEADVFDNGNPVNIIKNTDDDRTELRMLLSTYINIHIAEGLTFRTTFNTDWTDFEQTRFVPSSVGGFRAPPPQLASGLVVNQASFNLLNENTLTYDKTFGTNHRINALLGYSVQQEKDVDRSVSGSDYPDDVVKTIGAANVVSASESVQEWRLLSYFGRVKYAFADKYLLSATIRRDGSSRFGQNNRWGVFPSGSVGWRVSEESFFPQNDFISDLKLRASYGLAGNNSIGNYTYIPGIGGDDYVLGGTVANGGYLTSLANQNLGWESSQQLDIGMDVELLSGRMYFTAEYYRTTTEEMLQNISIPVSSGYGSAITNLGEVRNQGVELSLDYKQDIGELNWNANFNISFNRNEVLDIGDRPELVSGEAGSNITVVGEPMGMFYGYKFEGIYQSQEEIDNSPSHSSSVPGTVKYADINGDGIITTEDRTIIGNPYPDFSWGFTNRFNYKGFDLSILLVGNQGRELMDLYKRFSTNLDGVFNVERDVINRWRSAEDPGNGFIPTTVAATPLAREVNSLWVKDASYLSVQNIMLGYSLKTNFISNMRFYISAQNALIFTPYENGFPEVSFNGNNSLAPGVNYTPYPMPATYTLGVNVNF